MVVDPGTPKMGAVYVRVSMVEQKKGWSPETQRHDSLQIAREFGYVVPDKFIFNEGISGDFWERPAFPRLRQCVHD